MDVKHLRELITIAKEHGLKSLSFNGIKFELCVPVQAPVNHQAEQLEALKSDMESPHEDEILYWSTDYYEDLKGQRKDASLPPGKVPNDGH